MEGYLEQGTKGPNDVRGCKRVQTRKMQVMSYLLSLVLNCTAFVIIVIIGPSTTTSFVKVHGVDFSELLLSQRHTQFIWTLNGFGEEVSPIHA